MPLWRHALRQPKTEVRLSRTHVRMKLGRTKAGEGGFEPNPLDHPK
jgi:hypothetical protein